MRLWSAVMKKLGSVSGLRMSSFLCHSTWKIQSSMSIYALRAGSTTPPTPPHPQPWWLCSIWTWSGVSTWATKQPCTFRNFSRRVCCPFSAGLTARLQETTEAAGGLFVFLLSLDPMHASLLYISYALAAAILPPGTHHIIGLSSSRPPCFLLQGQPLWCFLFCFFSPLNCSWHLPSHFPVNSLCAGELWWGNPPPLISTASDWLANPLIALLLKQLVLLGDREDTADEVKQLDPVWSCKRRHTPTRDVKGWARIRWRTSVCETEDTGRWQSDKEWDRE